MPFSPSNAPLLWKIRGASLDLTDHGVIVGILNMTPDSFSDGGQFYPNLDQAVEQAHKMLSEGAKIIDIGGESTRPGAAPVSENEELKRVLPIIKELAQKNSGFHLSIDTSKPSVAQAAIDAGAHIINDVSGLRDPEMLSIAEKTGAGIILMHMQGTPQTMQESPRYENVVEEVKDFFEKKLTAIQQAGIDPQSIVLDPGIGFGKTLGHNLALLRNTSRLAVQNRPLMIGHSRKSFLGKFLKTNTMETHHASTVALTALLRSQGVQLLRVHDVEENLRALQWAEGLLH